MISPYLERPLRTEVEVRAMTETAEKCAEPTPDKWTHIKATEYHGHFVEDQFGNTVCDLYTMQGSCHPFKNAEQHAKFIAAAPDTAAERDRLKTANAVLLTAIKNIAERPDVQTEQDEQDIRDELQTVIDKARAAQEQAEEISP